MPGLHSPSKLAARRDRAIERKFLLPRSSNQKYIEVSADLAHRAKATVKALAVHQALNVTAGKPFHFASHAALAARTMIGDDAFKKSRSAIKKGNAARHSWADLSAHDYDTETANDESGIGEMDPLALNDPWAAAAACLLTRPDVSRRPNLPILVPVSSAPPASSGGRLLQDTKLAATVVDTNAKGVAPTEVHNDLAEGAWQQLAISQQHTVASLSQQLWFSQASSFASFELRQPTTASVDEASFPAASLESLSAAWPRTGAGGYYGDDNATIAVLVGQVDALSDKLVKLTADFSSMKQALPKAVEESLDKRMPASAVHNDLELIKVEHAAALEFTRNLVQESGERTVISFTNALSEMRSQLTESMCNHVERLITDYDTLMCTRLETVARDFEQLRDLTNALSVSPLPAPTAVSTQSDTLNSDTVWSGDVDVGSIRSCTPIAEHDAGNVLDSPLVADDIKGDLQQWADKGIYVDAPVNLVGLNTTRLNGASGMIVSYDEKADRFGVRLQINCELNAIRPSNLAPFEVSDECCPKCFATVNLHSFPPCSCDPSNASESSDSCHVLGPAGTCSIEPKEATAPL